MKCVVLIKQSIPFSLQKESIETCDMKGENCIHVNASHTLRLEAMWILYVCLCTYVCMCPPLSSQKSKGGTVLLCNRFSLLHFKAFVWKTHGESLRGNSALLSTTVEGIIARLLTCWKGRGKWMTLSTGRSERSSWKGGEKHSHMKWSEWVYLDHLILKKTFFISFTLLAFPKLFLIPYCKSEVSY